MKATCTVLAFASSVATSAALAGEPPGSAYDLLRDVPNIVNLPGRQPNVPRHARQELARQREDQGQRQGHGQSQSIRNTANAGNHNGNVRNAANNVGTSSSRAVLKNANTTAGNTTTTTTSVGGDSYVQQAAPRAPVSSAIAPALSAGQDACMGSTSVGAQGIGLGVSFGNTWMDDNCVMLKNSTQLWNMGKPDAAVALMCNNDRVREALELSGTECPQTRRKREEAGSMPKHVSDQGEDPYIAARMRRSAR